MLEARVPEIEESLRAALLRRSRRRGRLLHGFAPATVVLLGLGGGATAVALNVESDAPTSPTSPAQIAPAVITDQARPLSRAARERYHAERASAVPFADPRPDFAVLRQTAEPSDALPSNAFPGTHVGKVDRAGSRLALNTDLGDVRVTPTDREVCVSTTFTDGSPVGGGATDTCVPVGPARRFGAVTFTQCVDPTRPQLRFVAGAVPDGVSDVKLTRGGVVQAQTSAHNNAVQIKTYKPFDTVVFDKRAERGVPPVAC